VRVTCSSSIDAERDDRVVVALGVPAGASIPLGGVFRDGEPLRDAYSGQIYVARGGAITVPAAADVVLLERIAP
jgi:alpha-amylase